MILDKLENGLRLDFEDGLKLYDLDLLTLGYYASKIRYKLYNKNTFYNINRHINPTNICADVCQFCSFSASRKNPNPYTMTHEQILDIVRTSVKKNNITEVHIVSAHNNQVGIDWYFDIFKKIKNLYPSLHIKALTGAEINFISGYYKLSYEDIIKKMIESGVDSMPGGGAEIFDEGIRKKICGGKVSSKNWLKIHQLWHQQGKKSNATMLFGHIENYEHRIDHILRIRDLQDKTNGFNAFIPLVYQIYNNYLKVDAPATANDILKTIAISRILLDNIPHIKAYWVTSSIKLALIAQEFGADDLDGTIEKESINSAAGANSASGMNLNKFTNLIKNSGFVPIQRDSLYNIVHSY